MVIYCSRERLAIAPGGRNMIFQEKADQVTVSRRRSGSYGKLHSFRDRQRSFLRSEIFGPHLLGVVLTGMGNDGSKGVKAMKAAGGQVLAESEGSAVIFGMPRKLSLPEWFLQKALLAKISGEIMQRCGVSRNRG